MTSRGGETPMEFEWDSGHGPSDITSPFMQITQKLGTKRGFDSPSKQLAQEPSSFFGTPAKAFRNPGFESTPSRILQQQQKPTPFRDAPFTTPRKPFDADLFSEASGAESSPGMVGDNEDTPETRPGRPMKAFSAIKPKDGGGLFSRYGKLSHSPGRGEIRRGNKYEIANPQRVMKRRRMDREREQILTTSNHSRRTSFDTEDEDSQLTTSSRVAKATSAPVPRQGYVASILSFVNSHPDLPSTITKWVQFLFNLFMTTCAMWCLYAFLSAIRADIEMEAQKEMDVINSEIAKCVADYTANRCAMDTRLPALEGPCRAWEDCFNRDPERVGRARVSANTFAVIINNFFDGFSFKTIAVLSICASIFMLCGNMGFSAASKKFHDDPTAFVPGFARPPQHQQQQWDPRPAEVWFQQLPALQASGIAPTPSRGMRGERGQGNEGWGEEFRAIMPSGSPMKSPMKSPRKNWN